MITVTECCSFTESLSLISKKKKQYLKNVSFKKKEKTRKKIPN